MTYSQIIRRYRLESRHSTSITYATELIQQINLWGRDLHSQLVHLNEYDLKLFKLAADEIERRASLIPFFPRLLEDFGRSGHHIAPWRKSGAA